MTETAATENRRAPKPAVEADPTKAATPASRAPKVTPADVEAAIASEHYYTGAQGMAGLRFLESAPHMRIPTQLAGVMHCTLICKNGQLVTGESFCADLDNPDLERAKASARRRAFDKLYDAVVYAARERLSTGGRA